MRSVPRDFPRIRRSDRLSEQIAVSARRRRHGLAGCHALGQKAAGGPTRGPVRDAATRLLVPGHLRGPRFPTAMAEVRGGLVPEPASGPQAMDKQERDAETIAFRAADLDPQIRNGVPHAPEIPPDVLSWGDSPLAQTP